jgi:hypothetical protein
MAKPIRRIVTGHNAAGKSIIMQDGMATSILELPAAPGLRVTDLWETTNSPADLSNDADPVARPVHLEPAATGTICRIVEFPPDAVMSKGGDPRKMFDSLGASHTMDKSSKTPGMHRTASVDYAMRANRRGSRLFWSGRRYPRQDEVGKRHSRVTRSQSLSR